MSLSLKGWKAWKRLEIVYIYINNNHSLLIVGLKHKNPHLNREMSKISVNLNEEQSTCYLIKALQKNPQISILILSKYDLTEAFTQVRNMNGITRTPSSTSLHKSKVKRS